MYRSASLFRKLHIFIQENILITINKCCFWKLSPCTTKASKVAIRPFTWLFYHTEKAMESILYFVVAEI